MRLRPRRHPACSAEFAVAASVGHTLTEAVRRALDACSNMLSRSRRVLVGLRAKEGRVRTESTVSSRTYKICSLAVSSVSSARKVRKIFRSEH